jgi:peptide-methionine (S)-S-oxide reductase
MRSIRQPIAPCLVALVAILNNPAHAQTPGPKAQSPTKPSSTTVNSNDQNTSKSNRTQDDSKNQKPQSGAQSKGEAKLERATFGGGCFWCIEAVYERIPGVKNAVSGYSGGSLVRPSYEMVSTGQTGHAEVVELEFDPNEIPYEKLVEIFFHAHNPTTLNEQGPDHGTQYRSVIFYHSPEQQKTAAELIQRFNRENTFGAPVVTELAPFQRFWPAENYHQNYYRNNRTKPYCQINITPKLKKLGLIK